MITNRNTIKAIICGAIGTLGLSACNDSFLEKYPETSITESVFFRTPQDLETYTNGLYGNITAKYWDVASDNVLYTENSTVYSKMRDEIDPDNVGTWGWSGIRSVNFMLSRCNNIQGDAATANHYIGLARMMRAKLYYDKVWDYSDVPWYDRDLQTTDEELLYKTQDPRSVVVDKIMEDLDFAVNHMVEKSSRTLWDKYGALAMQARIALWEASWRKYHAELQLNDADRFYQIAIEACKKIMESGKFELFTTPNGDIPAYEAMFCSTDLSSNKEMIFYEDYSKELDRLNNANSTYDWTTGLSRDLMEDYLVIENGKTKTFQEVPGYDKKGYTEIFENRDPRLKQTFISPGFTRPVDSQPSRQKISLGGYAQIKFSPKTSDQCSWQKSYTDLPVIRYAEVLLMYAEAKAELGQLTQDDIDKTINIIRDRVGMPHAQLSEWMSKIDPTQEQHYPNVTSSQKGAILEIRRERRIELACEGFRYDDLMRWACGKLMEKAPEGMYIDHLGYIDVTGDGQPDYALVATQADADAIPAEDKERYKLTIEVLEGNSFSLSEGTKGYIRLNSQVGAWKFEEPKCYYYPISTKDQILNPNLTQTKYWK